MAIERMVEASMATLRDVMTRDDDADVAARRRTLTQHADRLAQAGNNQLDDPWATRADADTIAFSPTIAGGRPLLINGKATTFWPAHAFPDMLARFREAVARGEFDPQLGSDGGPVISPKIEGEQTPADLDNGSLSTGGGRTDADEAEARFTENLDNRLVTGE